MRSSVTRRRFLLASAAGLASAACGPAPAPPASGPAPSASSGQSPSRKIIIVGGGLSGLAIAFDLAARGFDPTVLEASERPGGRIHTVRAPFQDGLYVEAGATHVVPDPDLIKLIGDVGVDLTAGKPRPKGLSHAFLRGD